MSAKPADDEVFDLNLNAVKAETDLRPFRFLWGPDNKRFELAHRDTLDHIPLVEAAVRGGENEATLATLRAGLGKEQWAEFRKIPLPAHKLEALMEGYAKHCGIDLPES